MTGRVETGSSPVKPSEVKVTVIGELPAAVVEIGGLGVHPLAEVEVPFVTKVEEKTPKLTFKID